MISQNVFVPVAGSEMPLISCRFSKRKKFCPVIFSLLLSLFMLVMPLATMHLIGCRCASKVASDWWKSAKGKQFHAKRIARLCDMHIARATTAMKIFVCYFLQCYWKSFFFLEHFQKATLNLTKLHTSCFPSLVPGPCLTGQDTTIPQYQDMNYFPGERKWFNIPQSHFVSAFSRITIYDCYHAPPPIMKRCTLTVSFSGNPPKIQTFIDELSWRQARAASVFCST